MDIMEVEMSLIEVEEDIFMDFKEEENCVVKFEWEKLVNTKEEDFRGGRKLSYINGWTRTG